MGCTSSAPNTSPLNAHTADKSIQFEEEAKQSPSIEVDVAGIEDEKQTNETKVLPPCDTLQQTVHLVRNNKSTSLTTVKDVLSSSYIESHAIESEIVININEKTQDEVKIPKLELLMDKVFETNHHLNDSVPESEITDSNNEKPVEITETNHDNTDKPIEPVSTDKPEPEDDKNTVEEETEEASPSQSQCSRATRWEALADIAAELPPSLAVDPLTGQIYQIALHK